MVSERVQRQIDGLLERAERAIAQFDWSQVRDCARAALDLDPENKDAQTYLAAAERNLTGASPEPTVVPTGSDSGEADPKTPHHPTAFAGGRYQVKRFLGEGGKKRVYLAHDTLLDRDVAVALIKTEGLNEEGRERIAREAQAMGKLGDHPHIVTVHDIGDEGGQPYIVSQFMGGGAVEDLLQRAEGHRLLLEEAVRITEQVCQGLGHAHAHGIVHRDLKPGNVWLAADPSGASGQVTAKLGDFGLAVAIDHARLTQAGMMVGTVAYMPPEQATGGEVTARSDLYSLGCMLYEMVCGRPPFLGDDPVAIIGQHLNTPPVAPSWHRPDCPPGLEALLLRLLEKEPQKRPASARELGALLQSLRDGSALPQEGESQREGASAHPAATPENPLYRRVFVGREPELRQLHAAFDAALSGQGALVMVVGEPGIGKTALCEQLATYAALRGAKTLVGHCYEEGSLSLPYLPFIEATRSYVLARDPEGLKQDLGSAATEVARIVSEVRDRVQVSPSQGGDPEEQRWRLLQAVAAFLRKASQVQPLLLVLEDLHDADRGTLDMLLHLSRNLQGARLLIAGTYRDVEVDRAHPLSGALAELRRTAAFARIPLRGLTVDEVHRMMNLIRGQELSWSRAEAIHRQTEGNPLFVQEVLRYLVEEGLLVREGGRYVRAGGGDPDAGIPEGLRDVIGKRLSRLSEKANQVLSIASVIGREFRLDVLQKVTNPSMGSGQALSEDEVIEALEEAQERAVIEERGSIGAVTLRFTHAFFRQTLYEEIFAARRIRWHQQVARALEEVHARRLDEHATELAEHYAHSSDPRDLAKAVAYGQRAALRATAIYAYGEAVRLLEQALQAQEVLDPDDRTNRCDLLLALGEALQPTGDAQRAADTVAPEALVLAEKLGDRDRASQACQIALRSMVRSNAGLAWASPGFHEWVGRAQRHAAPGTVARAWVESFMARVAFAAGRFSEAKAYDRRVVALARELGDPDLLWYAAHQLLGWRPPREERERLGLVDEFARGSRTGVSTRTLGNFLFRAGGACLTCGERSQAEAIWGDLAELAERTRDPGAVQRGYYTRALLATLDGRLTDALEEGARLLARSDELGSSRNVWWAAFDSVLRAALYLGRSDRLLAQLAEAGARAGGEPLRMQPSRSALCLAHMGRAAEAAVLVDEWIDEWRKHEGIDAGEDGTPSSILATLLETALLSGRREATALLAPRLAEAASLIPGDRWLCSPVARLLGGAARLLGEPERARGYYEQAVEVCQKIRFRPEIALTRLHLGDLLLESYPGERAQALQHLDFAISEFREMKMQPSLERALKHKGLLRA